MGDILAFDIKNTKKILNCISCKVFWFKKVLTSFTLQFKSHSDTFTDLCLQKHYYIFAIRI